MAILLVSNFKRDTRRKKQLVITGTLSGNYVVGGIPVDWTLVTNPKLISGGKVGSNPTLGEVLNTPNGYSLELIPGATIKTWFLKIYTAPGVEMTAIAIPAALIADPVMLELTGPLGGM